MESEKGNVRLHLPERVCVGSNGRPPAMRLFLAAFGGGFVHCMSCIHAIPAWLVRMQPRVSTIHEYLDWTVTAIEPHSPEDLVSECGWVGGWPGALWKRLAGKVGDKQCRTAQKAWASGGSGPAEPLGKAPQSHSMVGNK
jgi:hypothetical protein